MTKLVIGCFLAMLPGSLVSSAQLADLQSLTVALGDSLINGGGTDTHWAVGSWFNQAVIRSRSRVTFLHNAGLSGDTTEGMLNRLPAEVLSLHPGKCIVAGGTNDIGLWVGVNDQVMANLIKIVNALRENSIQPFLCTLPPRGNGLNDTALNDLNQRIRNYAANPANQVTLIDVYNAAADPATGNYRSGYSYDRVHPTEMGAKAIAEYALQNAPALYGRGDLPYLPRSDPDGANLLQGGLFLNDTNRDGVPDSWSAVGPKAGPTLSLKANLDGTGNWVEIAKSSKATGQSYTLQNLLQSGFLPGDSIAFVGRLQLPDSGRGGLRTTVTLDFLNSAGNIIGALKPLPSSTTEIRDGQWFIAGFVPSGTVTLAARLILESGFGTARFAQIGVVKR
jgi:lysophospholipase L1-like esterase